MKQYTLAAPVSLQGKGLHTGKNVTLTLKPAEENTGLGKQPVAPNRLAVGGKRAVGIEGGFAFFDIAAGVHAVVDVAVLAEVVLAEEAVAPCPVFGFIVFVLQVRLIGDKAFFVGDVTHFISVASSRDIFLSM